METWTSRRGRVVAAAALALGSYSCGNAKIQSISQWGAYGNTPGGLRYVQSEEIRPSNVGRLRKIWAYNSGDYSDGRGEFHSTSAFEATPILVGTRLVFCTPFNRVIALNPLNGKELWVFDPEIDRSGYYANQLVCRGVSSWTKAGVAAGACSERIFTGTNDGRLIALDAATGEKCRDFGDRGEIDLVEKRELDLIIGVVDPDHIVGEYQVTSPPLVIDDLVIVGSAVVDNQRTSAPSGVVRAFDVVTGAERWPLPPNECAERPHCPDGTPDEWCHNGRLCPPGWDLAPESFDYKKALDDGRLSRKGYALGTPNVWSVMSADETRGWIFVPTGNPSPDFYRGAKSRYDLSKMDEYGSSVVAIEAKTGRRVWNFQTVRHDLWDYDVPAQPVLFELVLEGKRVDALAQATKTGHVFMLDRQTGKPVGEAHGSKLYRVDYKDVPRGGALGETLAHQQPFPTHPPSLSKHGLEPEQAFGFTGLGTWRCRNAIAAMRSDGIFTPPSLQGTVMMPGSVGGLNWSGLAIDEPRQILVANANNLAYIVRLFPEHRYLEEHDADPDAEVSPQEGTAFGMRRDIFLSPLDIYEKLDWIPFVPDYLHPTCNPPPWGTLNAVDLATGEIKWQVPMGGAIFGSDIGLPSLGGAIVTETGLVFIAGSIDEFIRAFDIDTGRELWREKLPAGGQATPMSYEVTLDNGKTREIVVIAAGGHAKARSKLGGKIVAFALPD